MPIATNTKFSHTPHYGAGALLPKVSWKTLSPGELRLE